MFFCEMDFEELRFGGRSESSIAPAEDENNEAWMKKCGAGDVLRVSDEKSDSSRTTQKRRSFLVSVC